MVIEDAEKENWVADKDKDKMYQPLIHTAVDVGVVKCWKWRD